MAAMANMTRAVLRLLMQYAVETELRHDNPVIGLKAYRTGTRHTWTEDELAQFERRLVQERTKAGLATACMGQERWSPTDKRG